MHEHDLTTRKPPKAEAKRKRKKKKRENEFKTRADRIEYASCDLGTYIDTTAHKKILYSLICPRRSLMSKVPS